jgi:hypothetical protein
MESKAMKRNRKPVDAHSAGTLKMQGVIAQHPGSTSTELAALSCYSVSHVKNVLAVLSQHKIAMPVPRGVDRCWYMAAEALPLLEQWDRIRRKRNKHTVKPVTKRDKIHAMSMEPGGVSMAQIMAACSIGLNNGGRHTLQMVHQGRLFRGERQGCRLRWFDTAERAQEWAAMPPMEPSEWSVAGFKAWANPARPRSQKEANREAARQVRLVAIGERLKNSARQPSKAPPKLAGSDQGKYEAIKAKPAQPAPVTLHGKPSDMRGTVDYSKAKITICPAPVSVYRYQYDPTSDAHRAYVRQLEQLRGAA